MTAIKNVFAIIGSASKNSACLKLVQKIGEATKNNLVINIFDTLNELPHFDPELSVANTPQSILNFRNEVSKADAILICTPEYIFSIPSALKNAIEWCVSTTVFSNKPIGLITASLSGIKAHEELQLIMKTVQTNFTEATTLLIQAVKSKLDADGNITDVKTSNDVDNFTKAFIELANK